MAAFSPEITPIKRALKGFSECETGLCGIGLVNSALGALSLLNEHEPSHVLFIGSVGSVSERLPLLSIISAKTVTLKDHGDSNGLAELLPQTGKRLIADKAWLKKIRAGEDIHLSEAYSTLAITRSKKAAEKISSDLIEPVESLELYGVAAACYTFGVSWNSLQAVTNHVDKNGHQQWKKNCSKAATLTALATLELLSIE